MYMNRAIKLKQASKQKIKYKEGEVVRIWELESHVGAGEW